MRSTPLARKPMKRSHHNTGPSSAVVDAVLERAQYSCEVCGLGLGPERGRDWSVHHRRPRKMGGSNWPGINLPSNLLAVCGHGTQGCHSVIESNRSGSVAAGWLVLAALDPAGVAVLVEHGSRWVYLTRSGGYSDHPDGAA